VPAKFLFVISQEKKETGPLRNFAATLFSSSCSLPIDDTSPATPRLFVPVVSQGSFLSVYLCLRSPWSP